jgi:hypothetical protein
MWLSLQGVAFAQSKTPDEGKLVAASLSQCTMDLETWKAALDRANMSYEGKPASIALACREELLDRVTMSERVSWYGFNREAARADWIQVRDSFGLQAFLDATGSLALVPGGEIVLDHEAMKLANTMLSESASLKALLDTLP